MLNKIFRQISMASVVLALGLPQVALAYIGPGTGLSAIGSFLALLVGVVAVLIGFLWYPIKRIFGKQNLKEPEIAEGQTDDIVEKQNRVDSKIE